MKTYIKNLFTRLGGASCVAWVLPLLIAGLGLIPAGRVTAQTFTNLHSFTDGSDGAFPLAGLILSSNTLYGTAEGGGSSGYGTVFAVNTNGTGFTNLYSFTATSGSLSTNSDGAKPHGGLILSNNTLYGTANQGGSSGNGTVFAVNTDGTGFTNLHSFTARSGSLLTNSDGANPSAGLVLSGNTLYGTAQLGGSAGNGTVFAVNTNGTGFANMHSFTALSDVYSGTNSAGTGPQAGLILSGNILYGTANGGGSWDSGTVFKLSTNGTGFTNLHSFTARSAPSYTNSDGATPVAGLILSGNTLYGTASVGGSSGNGTVFAVNTNGTGFKILHIFSALGGGGNSDGANPLAGLILSGTTLYGTAPQGGSWAAGTVFAVNVADTTPPSVTLDSISHGQILTNNLLPGVFGTASDPESGIASVTVSLMRITNSVFAFWTGTSWDSNQASLPAAYNATNGTWILNDLPSGGNLINADYQVMVNATNNESPAGSREIIVSFSVDYHPVFVWTAWINNDWDNAGNWDVVSVPTPDARVIINGGTPDYAGLGSLPLYRLDMSGGSLTTSGMLINKLNLSGGTISAGAINISLNGVFNWSGGTISGTYQIPAGASFNRSA